MESLTETYIYPKIGEFSNLVLTFKCVVGTKDYMYLVFRQTYSFKL